MANTVSAIRAVKKIKYYDKESLFTLYHHSGDKFDR